MTITTTRLDNGLRVVTESAPDLHSVAIGFWVGTGSRDEAPAIAGASHFLEHLLFKGTDTRSARTIAEEIDAVGGEMNAFTTKEYTAFYVRVLPGDLELALDILVDIMFRPAFRPDEVEAERQVILEEILMHGDEPADLAHELAFRALYPDHALGVDPLGDEKTVAALGRTDIADFFSRHYRPGNMVVAAAGSIDADALVDAIAERTSGVTGGAPPTRQPPGPRVTRRAHLERPSEQTHVVLAVRSLDTHSPDRYALSVVDQAVGGGMSSRLFQEVREARGLAYSVYSFRAGFTDAGVFGVYAGTAPDRVDELLDVVRGELDAITTDGLSAREVEVAKGHLRGSLLLGLEDSAARMSRIARAELIHGEVPAVGEVLQRIDAVGLHDANRIAAETLESERVLAIVGPLGTD